MKTVTEYYNPDNTAVLPPGYTQTEVGVIPEDWGIEKVRDIASITTGKRNTQDKVDAGTYPFFVRSSVVERINSYSFDGEAVLTAGDGVGTGKVFHYIKGKFDFHQRVYKISDFRNDFDAYFFYLYFSNSFYDRIMSMTAKTSVDSVRLEMIANMQIPHPPLTEQRAIATALQGAEALIEAVDKLIAKKRAVKLATMQQLLTGKTRLPGFGGDWTSCELSKFSHFSKGSGIKKDEVTDEGVGCIRYGEIYTKYNDYFLLPTSRIPRSVAAGAVPIKKGDLLFAGSGETAEEIGKCIAYLGEDVVYAGGDIIVCSQSGQDSLYLGHLLNHQTVARQKARLGQGDAVVHISAANLGRINLRLPPLDEQRAIATVLSDMDAEIAALERRWEKTRAIKQGMMQALLTGRVRFIKRETNA